MDARPLRRHSGMGPLASAWAKAGRRVRAEDASSLEKRLDAVITRALSHWRSLRVDRGAFVTHLARHVPRDVEDPERVLHVNDFILAFACSQGDSEALELLETRFLARLRRTLMQRGASDPAAHDTIAEVREILLVGSPGQPPRISGYSGRGTLQGWLQVIAARSYLRARRTDVRRQVIDEEQALLGEPRADDPEIEHLRAQYGAEFKVAFKRGLATLSARDRNLLKQHYVDSLSVKEVAGLYKVHRTTAIRWLNGARLSLWSAVRDSLTGQLDLPKAAFDSLLRILGSELAISTGELTGMSNDSPNH